MTLKLHDSLSIDITYADDTNLLSAIVMNSICQPHSSEMYAKMGYENKRRLKGKISPIDQRIVIDGEEVEARRRISISGKRSAK